MTAHCFPNLSRGLGIERPADQRRAAAQLNTLNLCLHSPMMCPIKRGMGGGTRGDAGYKDAAPKDMPFLPGYAGLQEERNAFTHPGMLFPFSLVDTERKKNKIVWLRSFALCRETPRQSQEEERDAAPISCPQTVSACQ